MNDGTALIDREALALDSWFLARLVILPSTNYLRVRVLCTSSIVSDSGGYMW